MAELGIQKDDPLFLILISMDCYYDLIDGIGKTLHDERELLESKVTTLSTTTDRFVESAKTLDCRLKAQVPRSFSNSGLLVRELAVAVAIAFVAGGVLLKPLLRTSLSLTCEHLPTLCEVSE